MGDVTGASEEVLRHHAELHARTCGDAEVNEFLCPCGTTVAMVCTRCEDCVFIAVVPGTWCEHAAEAVTTDE